jgi:spore coat protein CotH
MTYSLCKHLMLIAFTGCFLAACGGGGGGGGDAPTTGGNTGGSGSGGGSTGGGSTGGGGSGGGGQTVNTNQLAIVRIDTLSNTIVDEPKVQTQMRVIQINSEGSEVTTYSGYAGVEFRGASSQSFAKKSYGVETRNADDSNLNTELMGFASENDWVFHGPYSDKSLMRNPLMFSIASDLGRYAPRWQHFDLYINDDYQGIYVLLEKIKRDVARVDISKLKEDENDGEDVTGGYILKVDKTVGDTSGTGNYNDHISFTSDYRSEMGNKQHHFIYDTPDPDEITDQQRTYIQDYIGAFEDALKSADFTDETNGYPAFIDIDSFVDYFILSELGRNVDGYRLSTYLVKDKNQKLAMGPIWDLNLAFGNADYCDGGDYQGWAYQFNSVCPNDNNPVPFWWSRLLADPAFAAKVKSRWQQLRLSTLANNQLLNTVDDMVSTLEESESINRNFDVWDVLGRYLWPNAYVGDTFDDEVQYLKGWLQNRAEWLDDNISEL